MSRTARPTHFDRSTLVRRLAGLAAPSRKIPPAAAIGTQLGEWIDFNDAMTLFSALHDSKTAVVSGVPDVGVARDLGDLLARERAALMETIRAGIRPGARTRIKWPALVASETPLEIVADFAAYHRYYQAHQREMDVRVGTLRAAVRNTITARVPSLRQLTALDAAFDKVLGPRERDLLAQVPFLLEKRFVQLRESRPAEAPDTIAAWMQPRGWLATFARDMQGVLMAELEMRLQPIIGLIATLSNKEARQE